MRHSFLLSVFIVLCLLIGTSYAASPPITNTIILADGDGDGVDDSVDLCPGTAPGVAVNAYGCPLSVASCDYSTSVVTINTTGGSSGTNVTTRYVLASNTGTILQINTVPTFNGLSGTATYMALAITFEGAATNLTAGQSLSSVSATCYDWSDALVIKVCVAQPSRPDSDQDGVPDSNDLCPGTALGVAVNAYGCPLSVASCDYSTSVVTLNTTGGSSGINVTTRYVLASNTGTILQVNTVPTFNGLSGTATYMALAITFDGSATNLTAGQPLSAVTASCFDWSDALVFRACVSPQQPCVIDSDGDGVSDCIDLCPGTAPGVAVNAYGCPLNVANCDYTTSVVTLNTTGASSSTSVTTRYVLASNTGTILQVNTTPTFSGLSGTATYMALAITFDGSATNLTAGQPLSAVNATCYDWSDALVIKVCVMSGCDYQLGQVVTLQTTGGSLGAGVQTLYVLTDQTGKILQVNATASFPTTGYTAGMYIAYAVTYNNDNSIQHLSANGANTISMVTANCLAVSSPLSFSVCDCAPKCIPIAIQRLR